MEIVKKKQNLLSIGLILCMMVYSIPSFGQVESDRDIDQANGVRLRIEPVSLIKAKSIIFGTVFSMVEQGPVESPKGSTPICCRNDNQVLCNISTLPTSCNLIDETIARDEVSNDLWNLLSTISTSTKAKENNPARGKKEFCEKCYADVYRIAFKKDDIADVESSLKNKLILEALRKNYNKSLLMHYEQRVLYNHYNKTGNNPDRLGVLDKVIAKMSGGDEKVQKKLKDELQCNNMNRIETNHQTDCDQSLAASYMTDLIKSYDNLHEGGLPEDFRVSDAFSPKVTETFQNILKGSTEVLAMTASLTKSNPSKLFINQFNEYFKKGNSELKSLCSTAKPDKEMLYEILAHSYPDVTRVSKKNEVISIDSKTTQARLNQYNIKKEDRLILMEQFRHKLSVMKMLYPESSYVFDDPSVFCQSFSLYNEGKVDSPIMSFKELRKLKLIEAQDESSLKELDAYYIVKKQALANCGDPKLKEQKKELLCGKLSIQNQALPLEFDELSAKEKVIASKIQCSENIYLIDKNNKSRVFPKYYDSKIPENLLLCTDKKCLKEVESNLIKSSGSMNPLPTKIHSKRIEQSKTSDGMTSVTAGHKRIKESEKYKKYVEKHGPVMQNPFAALLGKGDKSSNKQRSSSQLASTGKDSGADYADKAVDTNTTYNNFVSNEKLDTAESDFRDSRYGMSEVNNAVRENSDYQSLLNAMPAKPIKEKLSQLTDVMNGKEVAFDEKIAPKNSEKEKDLQKQIDKLRGELSNSREDKIQKAGSKDSELAKDILERDKKIADLEKALSSIRNMKRFPSGNATSRLSAAMNNNLEKSLANMPKQNLGAVKNGEFQNSYGTNGYRNRAYNGIGKATNQINEKKLKELVETKGGEFVVDQNNRLFLVAKYIDNDTKYSIDLEDVVMENGKVTQLIYQGKKINIADLKSLSEESKLVLNNFALKGLLKKEKGLLVKDLDAAIVDEIKNTKPVPKEATPKISQYIQMLCTLDPNHGNCETK